MTRLPVFTMLTLTAVLLLACSGVLPVTVDTPVFETGVDTEAWSVVPAGEFFMGQHEAQVAIDYDFEIMTTLVTNSQFASYLNDALAAGSVSITNGDLVGHYPGDTFDGYNHEEEITGGNWLHVPLETPDLRLIEQDGVYVARPGYEDHPMVYVTWFGARGYCQHFGWRLPTEMEWEKAARGTDTRPYPWGGTLRPANANYYASRDPAEALLGKQGDTTPVGFYNGQTYDGFSTDQSQSPYGLFDMAGNVWQWTADDYPDQHYRYLRGGGHADYDYMLRVWVRNSAGPDYASPSVGFRCVRDR